MSMGEHPQVARWRRPGQWDQSSASWQAPAQWPYPRHYSANKFISSSEQSGGHQLASCTALEQPCRVFVCCRVGSYIPGAQVLSAKHCIHCWKHTSSCGMLGPLPSWSARMHQVLLLHAKFWSAQPSAAPHLPHTRSEGLRTGACRICIRVQGLPAAGARCAHVCHAGPAGSLQTRV